MATIPTPKTQGLNIHPFTQPPLDGSLSLPALYEWQAVHSPHHPVFIVENVPGCQRTILRDEGHQGFQRATRVIRKEVGYTEGECTGESPLVIAVLASAGMLPSVGYASST